MRAMTAAALVVAFAAVPATAGAAGRDRDHDGLPDRWERKHHITKARGDADRDGLSNRAEYRAGLNPRRRDTDRDGRWDGHEDTDRDLLPNIVDVATGHDPARRDTDRDGTRDAAEGAGQVVALDGETLTIALGTGRTVTGHAALPEALVCGEADEWDDVPASTRIFDADVEDDEGDGDGEIDADEDEVDDFGFAALRSVGFALDFEPEAAATGTWAPEQDLTDAQLDALEHAEAVANGDDIDEPIADACPPGALARGTWVHGVEIARSAEQGIEFEELVLVR